jgi:hypothetical protein
MLPSAAAALSQLEAEACLVRMYSAVARQLPETDEWDLSGLLVDGQPVSRAIVVAWLNAAYQHAYLADYEQQADSPACIVEGLYLLLAFADAVHSTPGMLAACCARLLQGLQLRTQLRQQQVSLETDGRVYAFVDSQLIELLDFKGYSSSVLGVSTAADAEQQAFTRQVAAQTEQLLWLACRLQLLLIVRRLHNFVRGLSFFPGSLLNEKLDAVFTPRVLEAAGVARLPGGKQMLVNRVLGETAQITGALSLAWTWLRPLGLTQQQQEPQKFDAVVARTGLRIVQGSIVSVELNLFGTSTIKLGQQFYPVQLRIEDSCNTDV